MCLSNRHFNKKETKKKQRESFLPRRRDLKLLEVQVLRDPPETPSNPRQELKETAEEEEAAGGGLAPPYDEWPQCSFTSADSGCSALLFHEMGGMEEKLRPVELHLELLMQEADRLQNKLYEWQGNQKVKELASMLTNLLDTCQPFFNYLESNAQRTMPQHTPLPLCSTLLQFSQRLCARLEQLVLAFAKHNLVSLVETDPDSLSQLYIGQFQVDRVRLTMFRYCEPAPFLAQADTGLYKHMRWNVEWLKDDQQHQTDGQQEFTDTEYYFLCHEEKVPEMQTESGRDGENVTDAVTVKIWSIGQWVQVQPDPETEDILDWILCEVPQATYRKLLCVGSEEPSSCSATNYLLELLLSEQTPKTNDSFPGCKNDFTECKSVPL
ncbi:UPF0575 protein C19orf67 homolog [Lampris incognitus]|uniref:UPF0575 protein C19orf67 homolog n=1 Tax=Lampris incognitus TaxID=2546036 RepID=UPI0024B4AB9B|nr:UPF0575 protein C19orf67 homolog [Lampris incognitus]